MCIRTIGMRCTDGIDPTAEPTYWTMLSVTHPPGPAPSPERAQALDQEAHEGGRVDVDGDTGVGVAAAAAAPVDDRAPARKLRRAVHHDVHVSLSEASGVRARPPRPRRARIGNSIARARFWSCGWGGSSGDFRRQWAAPRACRRTSARAPTPGWPGAAGWAGAGASKPGGAHRRAPRVVATRQCAGRTRRPGRAGAADRRRDRARHQWPPTAAGRGQARCGVARWAHPDGRGCRAWSGRR